MRRYILFALLLCLQWTARGQATYDYRYWFDSDEKNLQTGTVTGNSWHIDADVSELSCTYHSIHMQVKDMAGVWSAPVTEHFVKLPQKKNMTYRYWVDNDNSTLRSGEFKDDVMMLDVADIDDGFHVINFQVESNGNASAVVNRMFIKIPQTDNIGEMTCLCFIDGKVYKQEQVPSARGTVNWEIDVNSISQGIHRLQVQVLTPSGAASNLYDSFFFRSEIKSEIQEMQLLYSIDNEEYKKAAGSYANGLFHFDVDVASLNDGLHNMSYMLASDRGTMTKVSSTLFLKTPLGGPGIMSYKYWINEFETEAEYVKLSERKNPYELISLLPVKSAPICSNCFKFEISDGGTPMMYAKNDIHMQFFDVSNRVVEAHKQYVDYNVGQEIEDFTLLESGKRVYKTKPDENEVIWFKVEAVEGDSLSIKTDQACSLQIFSPSGKEMFTASGSESVVYDGCHAEEDGTYYIALHDVTGTKGTTIALDFQHIDKYDVLRWDVSTVGNGGASTITYEGNGFKDLYAIDYVNANGDTIKCDFIDHISDATISTITDYNGASIGSYKAIFHFTEKDKVIDNAVKVEEATEMKLGIKVNYPSTFLRGTSCTYNIQITNYGNSTAYAVPLGIQMYNTKKDAVSYVKFDKEIEKFDLNWMYDSIDGSPVPEDTIKAIQKFMEEKGDLLHFSTVYDSLSNKYIKDAYLTIEIRPNSTYNLNVEIKSDERINLKAQIPIDWTSYIIDNNIQNMQSKSRSGSSNNSICCAREKVECVLNVAVSVADLFSVLGGNFQIASCIGSASNSVIQFSYDVWCGDNRGGKKPGDAINDLKMQIINTIIGCIKPKWDKYNLRWMYIHVYDVISTSKDCVASFETMKGCPPNPPTGGSSDPVNSYDPNDIYGYRSESGSKAVMKGQKEVYYTIEFENDTAFATASAQDVYLTDTLDARYFDLKSFSPTSLKIGDKKVELNGDADFVTTVDMRPRINAIAQVECDYDSKTGIAKWHFSSLDPMTMEPVETPMDGFLPVNNSDGDGIGEVSFNINLKDDFEDGTEISNRASIVFDHNEAIITPTWTNIVDSIAPKGNIISSEMKNDTTLTLHLGGTDNRSGIWKYDIYVQPEVDCSWYKAGKNVADTVFNFILREGIDYGFCVISTDSAGNVEQKVLERQWSASSFKLGDANSDGTVDAADVVLTISKYLGNDVEINAVAADVNCDGVIDAQDIVGIQQIFLQSEAKPRGIETKKRIRLWQR